MRNILTLAVIVLACSVLSIAQSDLVTVAGPGVAGHPACRIYFGVFRVHSYDAVRTPSHGFTDDELRWWTHDGQKRAPGLCYMRDTAGSLPDLKAQCSQCPPDWNKSFYWFLMTRTVVRHKSKRPSNVPEVTEQPDKLHPVRQVNVPQTTFPDDDSHPTPDRSTVVVTADVYPVTTTDFAWNADRVHFKISKRGVFSLETPTSYEGVELDAFKAAAKQLLKDGAVKKKR